MAIVGLIGLGNMGAAFAGTLVRNGFDVVGTDLSAGRRAVAEAAGATTVGSIAEICAATDLILLSLPEARHVEAVVTADDGILAHARPGTVVADCTTSEPATSRSLAERLAAAGHAFLDTPVSGGPHGAEAGTLAIMVGGEASALERARPALAALSARLVHVSGSGAGNVAKLVNNLMAASHCLVAAEGVRLARRAGVDPAVLLEVVNASSGRSLMTERVLPEAVLTGRYDFGFSAALMRKDVRLALALAQETDSGLSVTAEAGRVWAASEATQPADADFTRVAGAVIDAD